MKKLICIVMAICILAVSAVTVAAEEPAAERFDIEFAQVVLGNALNIRFAFASEHRSDWTGAYAIAVKTYADGREDCVQRVDADQWKSVRIDGKAYYYFSFTNISGKEMTDEIHVTVYDSAGNAISNPYTDSIRAYVMRTLEKQGRKTQTMLVDMLNYGAAAQQYYGYGTDDLANCLLTSTQKAYGTQVLSPCRDIRDADANYLGTRLELKSSIVMQMGFRNITADMTAKVELTNHRGEMISKTVSPVSVGSGRLGIAVDQIVVADCRQATTVTVYNADGSIYATVTDSLESYIARMSDSDVLFEAIMKFADSSHAYLHESDTPAGIYLRTDDDGASYIVSSVGAGAASEIEIPETYQGKPVTQIAPDAFRNCTGLTKIVIPATITDVGADAFSGCTGLETICFEGTQEQWDAISKGSDWDKDCPYTLTFHIKGHRLGDWEIVREATCTEAGERRCYYTCGCMDENGDPLLYKTEVIPALGHSVVIDPGLDASCTEGGITEGSHCDRCGAVLAEQTTIGALGHRYSDALTCYDHQCLQDNCTHVEPATTEHRWTDWTYVESGGCSSVAYLVRTCLDCQITENTAGDQEVVTHHDWQFDIKAPTCTTGGYYKAHCVKCGVTLKEYYEPTGHNWVPQPYTEKGHPIKCHNPGCNYQIIDPHEYTCDCDTTCNTCDWHRDADHDWDRKTDGQAHWMECSYCHETKDREDHRGGTATCSKRAECEVCGTAYGSTLLHTWDNDCDTECNECHATRITEHRWEYAYVNDTHHLRTCKECKAAEYVEHSGGVATCQERRQCTRCGKAYGELGDHVHEKQDDDIVVKEPTCTEGGIYCRTCDDCGYYDPADTYQKNNIPGHDESGTYQITADGTQHYKICGREECRKQILLGDHENINRNNDYVVQKPTCTENGTYCHTCDACGYYDETDTYRRIDALGHDERGEFLPTEDGTQHYQVCQRPECREKIYSDHVHEKQDNDIVVKEPTCTEGGIYCRTCDDCGYYDGADTYQKDNALGHDESGTFQPTADGTQHYKICGREICRQEILTSDHVHEKQDDDTVVKEPTCTEGGIYCRTCDVCGHYDPADTYQKDNALGHDESGTFQPTADGTQHYKICGREICRQEILTSDHVHEKQDDDTVVKEPTCTEGGIYCRTCDDCGYYDPADTYQKDNARGHDESGTFQPTEDGTQHYQVCQRPECREKIYSDHVHKKQENDIVVKEPTCTEGGIYYHTCDLCGYHDLSNVYRKENPLDHEGGEATCQKKAICDRCNLPYGTYGAHKPETPKKWDDTDHWVVCEVCKQEIGGRGIHEFDNACDDDCNACGYTREVPDHVFDDACDDDCNECGYLREPSHTWATEYTSTDSDNTHWIVCVNCGAEQADSRKDCHGGQIICGEKNICEDCGYRYGAVQTHDFTVKHEIPENKVPNQQEPACGKGYLYYYACSRCGKLANNLTDTFEGSEKKACVPKPDYLPLAGDAEEHHIFCENCGKILSSAPHAFGEYELTKSPSCYQEGEEARTCSTCGYQDSRPVDERPHQLSQEIFVVTTPIPGQEGETVYRHALVYRCVNYVHCEYEETTGTFFEHFHEDIDVAFGVPATCTESGTTHGVVCGVAGCGEVFLEQEIIPALGHDFVDGICSRCGEKEAVYSVGLKYTLSTDKTYYIVSGIGDCTDTEIVIPATYEGLPVKEIGANAFKNKTTITSVVIPEGVTGIGSHAFHSCTSLTEVTLPDTLTSIGEGAFYYCRSLTEVTLPDTLTSIGDRAFYDCASLTEVTLPDTLTSIGDYAFYYCRSLTEVTLPATLTSVGDSVFRSCSSLTEVTLPDTLTSIGDYAFYYCRSLTEVTLPDTLTSIGDYAFAFSGLKEISIPVGVASIGGCAFHSCEKLQGIWVDSENVYYSSDESGVLFNKDMSTLIAAPGGMTGTYNVPTGVTYINDYAFCDSALTGITLPEGLISIGEWAFEGCGWTEISLPDTLETIGANAFFGCSSLRTIRIPASVTSIGEHAFTLCYFWDGIWVDPENACYSSDDNGVLYDKEQTLLIAVPCGKTGTLTVPSGVVTIGTYAFRTSYLREVILPEGLETIEDDAFYYAELKTITLPGSLTDIGSYAFSNCTDMETIYYKGTTEQFETITKGTGWLSNCPAEIICLGDSTASEGLAYTLSEDETYYIVSGIGDCTDTEIVIPATYEGKPVQWIANGAFMDNTTITSVVIPEGVTGIDSYAFNGCTSLTEITLPDTLTGIGDSAFRASGLRKVEIPEGVTSIGNAFSSCGNLEEVILPEGLNTISDWAFSSCSSLTKVVLPENVHSIGSSAFRYSGLEEINIPAGITSIGEYAFESCEKLQGIWVDADNAYFSSDASGALFSKDMTVLIAFPGGKTGTYTIPASVESIEACAFSDSVLTSITLPEGLVTIGELAFYNCDGLTEISLPDKKLDIIGANAFYDCDGLKTIRVPATVTSIGRKAFSSCDALDGIWVDSENSEYSSDEYGNLLSKDQTKLIMPGRITDGKFTVPEGIVSIGVYALAYRELTEVTLPDSLQAIDSYAFLGSGLTEITLPGSLRSIGANAFSGSGLTEITLPGSLRSIGQHAFSGSAVTKLVISDGFKILTANAIKDCMKLKSITLPASMSVIATDAIYYCPVLETIYFTGTKEQFSVIRKQAGAIHLCPQVKLVCLGDKAASEGLDYTLSADETYYIVSGIGTCTDTLVVVPDTYEGKPVQVIGDGAFQNSAVTGINLPGSISAIGSNAFTGCALYRIHFRGTKEQWELVARAEDWGVEGILCSISYLSAS